MLTVVYSRPFPASERVEWLVGSRPVGSKEIPPPVRALGVLTRLLDPWRKAG